MDWDLWGPPTDMVTEELDLYPLPDWQCDFYFGYGYDAIEEDALNEKSCIQVLTILIQKADSEINELEQDLVSLQSELAWIENEEWSEMCGNVLRDKISYLDITLRTLKDKGKNDIEVRLLMHVQPVESLHEILKALLGNYFHKKDEQSKDAIVSDPSTDALRHSCDVVDDNKNIIICYSHTTVTVEIKESNLPTKPSALNPSTELQEKEAEDPNFIKPANTNVKDSHPLSLSLAVGHSYAKKLSNTFDPTNNADVEAKQHSPTPIDKQITPKSYPNFGDKGRHLEMDKVQRAEIDASNSNTEILKHTVSENSKMERSGNLVEKEVEHSIVSTADMKISDSSFKPAVKEKNLGKAVKPTNAVVKDLGLDASKLSTGHSKEMKNFCNSHVKVMGNEDGREHCSRARGKSEILISSLSSEGKRTTPTTDKTANPIVRNVTAAASRCAKKGKSDSRLDTVKWAKSNNLDIEQRLCDFAPKAVRKLTMKESKIATPEHVTCSNSSLKTEGMNESILQNMKVGEPGLTETENCALNSLLNAQDQKGKNAVKPQHKEAKCIQDVKIADVAADENRFNLNVSLNPQREKAKNINIPILQEIGVSAVEVTSHSSFMLEGKEWQKSGGSSPNASSNQSFTNQKITKKLIQPCECEANKDGTTPHGSPSSVAQPEKKRKKGAQFPVTTDMQDATTQVWPYSLHTSSNTSKDDVSATDCSICDSSSEAVVSLPCPITNLKKLRLAELHNIAKELKLTKFHKLSKDALVELLTNHIGN